MNSKQHALITGGSGLIGSRLTELLLERGHKVSHLGRTRNDGNINSFIWNVDEFTMEPGALKGVDTIIHLAGAGVADKPWTQQRKQEILESRVRSASLLAHELAKGNHEVRTVISVSGISYYGSTQGEDWVDERSPAAGDFLASVCVQWEGAIDSIDIPAIRIVKLRTGVVLSEKGGALTEMARPVRWFVGAPLGTGEQFISWIHLDDLCRIFIKAAEDEGIQGTYNAVAPNPVTNRQFMKNIAKVLRRPIILPPVPKFVLKLLIGEMADMVLEGCRVSSAKIQQNGFTFQFTDLEQALRHLLKKQSNIFTQLST